MTTLFRNSEDQSKLPRSFKNLMFIAIGLMGSSIFFLADACGRIANLHATGRLIGPWHYLDVMFWSSILLFSSRSAWLNFKRYGTDNTSKG